MQLPDPAPHPEILRSAESYLRLADRAVPGLVEGLYIHGSPTYGDYCPGHSDIDFAAVLRHRPSPDETALLGSVLDGLRDAHPRPYFDGFHITRADLAAPPAVCPDVPCVAEWRHEPAARHGLDPVTWHELAHRAIALRGPRLTPADVHDDPAGLRAFTRDNLDTYWRPTLERVRAAADALPGLPEERAAALSAQITEWCVLGMARLYHLLATGRSTSKSGAGRHARAVLDSVWHPVIDEALRLRHGTATGPSPYGADPVVRVRDAIAFTAVVLDLSLRLPG
ncbi:aminoglycoside adenylyltransferase domain-containing protein [Streptomyces sp. RFCAC02]|uniref:aminoglycoside adenylyltransferase domain-containing protein n=1 Tax=Streptomyces sp. RFCAC02 TaxID=2499143 RepID=UPI001021AC27|nr:aminoglycoside adenylyltransferase domain-containing protein [Streptomyces sp. RFCAC02]